MAKTTARDVGWYSRKQPNQEYEWRWFAGLLEDTITAGIDRGGAFPEILGSMMVDILKRWITGKELGVKGLASGTVIRKAVQGSETPTTPYVESGEFLDAIRYDYSSAHGKMVITMGIDPEKQHTKAKMSMGKLIAILQNGASIHVTDGQSVSNMVSWLMQNLPNVYGPKAEKHDTPYTIENGEMKVESGDGGGGIHIDIPPRPIMTEAKRTFYQEIFGRIFYRAINAKIKIAQDALLYNPRSQYKNALSKARKVQMSELHRAELS